MKIGMELELWVVDGQGQLCDGRVLADAHELIKPEFIGPLVEIQTEPHECQHALRRDLQETLQTAIRAAEATDRHLVPLGTPLTTAAPSATDERGALFERIYGEGIQSAKNCAGMHVHFEKGNVDRQLNLLTALDPALALVSSSPYYCGNRMMDSSRAYAYRTLCGEEFNQFCDLWPFTEDVPEWEARVEEAYTAFTALAADRGVDRSRVEAQFLPENTVLNPVRLRNSLPTVEWRAPDTALPTQLVRLAFDVRDIIERMETATHGLGAHDGSTDCVALPEFCKLRELSQEAIRWGLHSERVYEYLEGMGLNTSMYSPISQQLGGPGILQEKEAQKIRLEYAKRLQEDVTQLTSPTKSELVGQTDGRYIHA